MVSSYTLVYVVTYSSTQPTFNISSVTLLVSRNFIPVAVVVKIFKKKKGGGDTKKKPEWVANKFIG